MKNRLTISFILIVTYLNTSIAAENWVFYFEAKANDKHNGKFYYDRSSIIKIEQHIFVVYRKHVHSPNSYTIDQLWLDCTTKMMAKGKQTLFLNGQEYASKNFIKNGYFKIQEPWNEVIIDTEWLLVPIICR